MVAATSHHRRPTPPPAIGCDHTAPTAADHRQRHHRRPPPPPDSSPFSFLNKGSCATSLSLEPWPRHPQPPQPPSTAGATLAEGPSRRRPLLSLSLYVSIHLYISTYTYNYTNRHPTAAYRRSSIIITTYDTTTVILTEPCRLGRIKSAAHRDSRPMSPSLYL